MLRRILFLVAATLMMMVACDGNSGDEPRDTYSDTSNGKGDNPNPTDTTYNDTTPETSVPDSVQVEDPCKDLYQYAGTHYGYPEKGDAEYDDRLTLSVAPSTERQTCITSAKGAGIHEVANFEGRSLPIDHFAWDYMNGQEYFVRLSEDNGYIRLSFYNGPEEDDGIFLDLFFIR